MAELNLGVRSLLFGVLDKQESGRTRLRLLVGLAQMIWAYHIMIEQTIRLNLEI